MFGCRGVRKKQGGKKEKDSERKKDKEENSLQPFMENGDECKVVGFPAGRDLLKNKDILLPHCNAITLTKKAGSSNILG